MPTVADAVSLLEAIAPLELAEEWDNVGLLVGDPSAPVGVAMTCLTLTPDVVSEAIEARAALVVTHHPLPFRGVKRLTTRSAGELSVDGDSLWRLIGAGVAVYCAHTAYDSAVGGVNDQWAERLGLIETSAMQPAEGREDGAGVGRVGNLAHGDFAALVRDIAEVAGSAPRVVAPAASDTHRVALACGSGGSLLDLALAAGADVFVTGELGFHDCLRCRALRVGVVLTGHYASERFAMESLALRLAAGLPGAEVFASRIESDPLRPGV